jgi:hypothetical protein
MKHLSCLRNVQAKIKTNRIAICLIALLLCSVASTTVRAGSDNGGMLYPKGTVTVNGVKTSAPIAVFPGDKIETTANSVAALATNGKVSFVNSKSSIVFNGHGVSSSNSNLGHVMARDDDEHKHKHHSPNKPCHGGEGDHKSGRGDSDKRGDNNNQGGNGDCDDRD